jgi:hypothetical protein
MERSLTSASTFIFVGIALEAFLASAEVTRPIDGVDTLTIGTDTGVPRPTLGGGARQRAVVVADGPVQPHRHAAPAHVHAQVGRPELVAVPVDEEGDVAGAVLHAVVRPLLEVDGVVGEAGRDVDVAAADAGAPAVRGALGAGAVGEAAHVVLVVVAAAAVGAGVHPSPGVAAEHHEHVPGVGDAEHAARAQVHTPVGRADAATGRAVALVGHRQHHLGLRPRRHRQARHRDRARAAGGPEHRYRRGAVVDAGDLEALAAGAAGPDAERVGDVDVAALRWAFRLRGGGGCRKKQRRQQGQRRRHCSWSDRVQWPMNGELLL